VGSQAFRNHVGAAHAKRAFRSLGPLKAFFREERQNVLSSRGRPSNTIYGQPTLEPINVIAARVISPAPNPVRIEDFLTIDSPAAVATLLPSSEQEFQDLYCSARGLPKRPQASKGIDYHDPLCGFIEFTTDGKVDSKDISTYTQQAGAEPYKIIFVDGVPPNQTLAEALVKLGIDWELFVPQAAA